VQNNWASEASPSLTSLVVRYSQSYSAQCVSTPSECVQNVRSNRYTDIALYSNIEKCGSWVI